MLSCDNFKELSVGSLYIHVKTDINSAGDIDVDVYQKLQNGDDPIAGSPTFVRSGTNQDEWILSSSSSSDLDMNALDMSAFRSASRPSSSSSSSSSSSGVQPQQNGRPSVSLSNQPWHDNINTRYMVTDMSGAVGAGTSSSSSSSSFSSSSIPNPNSSSSSTNSSPSSLSSSSSLSSASGVPASSVTPSSNHLDPDPDPWHRFLKALLFARKMADIITPSI